MNDKHDLNDAMIAGRMIDMVAPYSVRDCLVKLQHLKKGGFLAHERIDVNIEPANTPDLGMNFEIKRSVQHAKSRDSMRIQGKLKAINNLTTEIHGEVPSADRMIALGLFAIISIVVFAIIIIPPSIWGSSNGLKNILMLGAILSVPIYLVVTKRRANANKDYMLNLLRDTLQ